MSAVIDETTHGAEPGPRSRTGPFQAPRADRSRPSRVLEATVWIALALLVAGGVFLNDWGKIALDWYPQLYLAPGRTFVRALFAWRAEPFLGHPNIHVGLAPTAALIFFIKTFGLPLWVTLRIWRLVVLLIAGWGAVRLFRHLTGDRSALLGSVAVALVYVANPYVAVSGASLPTFLPYALLPWLLLSFHQALMQPNSWRWSAAFALVFFLMGGVNAGVVPLLLLLGTLGMVVYAKVAERIPLRRSFPVTARCLLLAGLVSLYWIVPSFLAQGSGSSIAFTSEPPQAVAATSSYSESLRLLGFWLAYGFQTNQLTYFSNALVVLASFALPLVAFLGGLLSRSVVRILGAILLAIGVPAMVGSFPPWSPTPFGRALNFGFFHIPGAIAFRTTNKSGAIAVLGLAMLIGLGARALMARRLGARIVLGGIALLVVAFSVYPAWTGSLYPSAWKLPDYWKQAAADVNAGSSDGRVLIAPGDFNPSYRWGYRGVEDLNEALLTRSSIVRPVLVYGSPYGANYLAALDVPLNAGAAPPGLVRTMSRYLGVSDVLLRNDTVWEDSGTARPSVLSTELRASGLTPVKAYGFPGENVVPTLIFDRALSPLAKDIKLSPLQLFSVPNPRPVVRAESTAGTLVIDGDSFALMPLQSLGMLEGSPSFRLLGSMSPAAFEQALREGGRVVLSDSNRRERWNFQRTDFDHGPLLGPQEATRKGDDESYALHWNDPDKQTVAVLEGARSVEASQIGSVFRDVASGDPIFAFDGDVNTAWVAGDAGTARSQWIQIDFDRPRTISRLTFRPITGSPLQVGSVRASLGSRSFEVNLPDRPVTTVRFPPTRASSLRIEITSTLGVGDTPVGFWDVDVPGVRVTKVARLPRTLSNLFSRFGGVGKSLLSNVPLDIVLTRRFGDPSNPWDDAERQLTRAFELPQPRSFTFIARARPGPELPEAVFDAMTGADPEVVATSSSRLTPSPFTRAAQAFDGDPYTAWLPGERRAWIDVRFPQRTLDHIVVSQGAPNKPTTDFAVRATLSLDGEPLQATLGPGRTRIDFPPRTAHELRLEIRKVAGVGGELRVNEIEIPGVRMPASARSTLLTGCVDLFSLDGQSVRARLRDSTTLQELAAGEPITFEPCDGQRIALGAGVHRLQASPGWLVDLLDLSAGSPLSRLPESMPIDGRISLRTPATLSLSGRIRAADSLSEAVVDHLVGAPPDIEATSSSRPFDLFQFRAARVLDGRLQSGWEPASGGEGESLDLRFPRRRLDHITIHQRPTGLDPARYASAIDLALNDRPPLQIRLDPRDTMIKFRPRPIDHIRITITRVAGSNGTLRISEVRIPGVRVAATRRSTPLTGCADLFDVDGHTLKARLAGTLGNLIRRDTLGFSSCEGQPLQLTSGVHTFNLLPGWTSETTRTSWDRPASSPGPRVDVVLATPSSLTLRAAPAAGPYYLVLGQAFDDRWKATIDGRPLGRPLVIDGYSVGWRVNEPGGHTFRVEYGPQRWARASQVISLAGLVLAVALLARGRRRLSMAVGDGSGRPA
jgi:arabinofuranan 3-O-arabinosyltransferase